MSYVAECNQCGVIESGGLEDVGDAAEDHDQFHDVQISRVATDGGTSKDETYYTETHSFERYVRDPHAETHPSSAGSTRSVLDSVRVRDGQLSRPSARNGNHHYRDSFTLGGADFQRTINADTNRVEELHTDGGQSAGVIERFNADGASNLYHHHREKHDVSTMAVPDTNGRLRCCRCGAFCKTSSGESHVEPFPVAYSYRNVTADTNHVDGGDA